MVHSNQCSITARALNCDPLPLPLYRWGSNVKWSVHRQREVTQRAKGIVGRTGPERERVGNEGIEKTAKGGRKSGRVAQVREGFSSHSVMTLIS